MGREVPGAGEFFTSPLMLQHRLHYTRLSFEVAPLASDYDIILPRWWLENTNVTYWQVTAVSSLHPGIANANAPEKDITEHSRWNGTH